VEKWKLFVDILSISQFLESSEKILMSSGADILVYLKSGHKSILMLTRMDAILIP